MAEGDVHISFRSMSVFIEGTGEAPITNLFDKSGDEISDPTEACSIVAGPLPNGRWIACNLNHDDCVPVLTH